MTAMSRVLIAALLVPFSSGWAQTPADGNVRFQFQNKFWVNLHHFVRAEARRRSFDVAPQMSTADLSGKERATWKGALDAYAPLAKLNLIFDERLININNALTTIADGASPTGAIEPEMATALNLAAPAYRAHLWEQHRRENQRWIAQFAPKIESHAASVIKALAGAYHASWPSAPIVVDLSCDSGPNLAYTTQGPPGTSGHTVIAPLKAMDADVAFELAFHEASHTVDSQIMEALDGEAAKQHVRLPEDLWHVLIFYTTGDVVRRELGKQNDPAYKTYADRVNLYNTAGWDKIRTALERNWQPYLDGKTSFETAVHDLVRDAGQH
jgi:hypothetical protein